eukprot:Hpha_TRINITY_DN15616_c5_g1::TRINITY_DN15616_c5_g1_i3::g.101754::m.101754
MTNGEEKSGERDERELLLHVYLAGSDVAAARSVLERVPDLDDGSLEAEVEPERRNDHHEHDEDATQPAQPGLLRVALVVEGKGEEAGEDVHREYAERTGQVAQRQEVRHEVRDQEGPHHERRPCHKARRRVPAQQVLRAPQLRLLDPEETTLELLRQHEDDQRVRHEAVQRQADVQHTDDRQVRTVFRQRVKDQALNLRPVHVVARERHRHVDARERREHSHNHTLVGPRHWVGEGRRHLPLDARHGRCTTKPKHNRPEPVAELRRHEHIVTTVRSVVVEANHHTHDRDADRGRCPERTEHGHFPQRRQQHGGHQRRAAEHHHSVLQHRVLVQIGRRTGVSVVHVDDGRLSQRTPKVRHHSGHCQQRRLHRKVRRAQSEPAHSPPADLGISPELLTALLDVRVEEVHKQPSAVGSHHNQQRDHRKHHPSCLRHRSGQTEDTHAHHHAHRVEVRRTHRRIR